MANRNINVGIGFSVDKTGLNTLQSELQQISNRVKNMEPKDLTQGLIQAGQTAQKLDGILEKTFNSNLGTLNVTKFNQELAKSGMTLKSVQTDLTNIGSQGATAYNRLAQAILGTNVQLRQTNKLLDSMATTMMNTVKWGITSSIFNTITNSIQKAYSYTKQLDTSLNDIRIVTSKSADEMDNFAEKANKAAKNLGASTLDYTKASLIYYQQGLSDEEVAARAETTVKVANVTGQTGDAVSEQLTAVWNGYRVSAEETEVYIDKLAAVAATTASDLEELSKGMSKVASAANAMGVDFDDLNAQIATIVSVTRQAPESVGTALKTIYARLGDLKVDGVDEFGVKLGEVSSQLQTMGIQILDANGDMRDMTSVMTEVAEKWNTWTRAQQQAAAVAMAGKRQYNNLVALFENWDMYSNALETSRDSLGTLQHQQDIYMESTAAKLKELKAAWQGLYQGLLKSDDINKLVDFATKAVEGLDKLNRSFGGGMKTIAAFGAIFANVFNKQISQAILQATNNLNVYKNNLALLETRAKTIEQGVALDPSQSTNLGYIRNKKNTSAQIEYAKKIDAVRGGFTEEQGQTAIQLQQEIGAISGEIEVIEQKAANIKITNEKIREEVGDTNNLLGLGVEKYEQLEGIAEENLKDEKLKIEIRKKQNNLIEDSFDKEVKKLNIEKNIVACVEELKTIYNNVLQSKKAEELFDEEQLKNVSSIEELRSKLAKILAKGEEAQRQTAQAAEKELENIRALKDLDSQRIDQKEQLKNKELEIQSILEQAAKGSYITNAISTFTNLASSTAMLISSINNLKAAFTDTEMSMSERIQSILMGYSMMIPATMQAIKGLGQLGTTFLNTGKILSTTGTYFKAHKIAVEASTLATQRRILAEELSNKVNKETLSSILTLAKTKGIEISTTNAETASQQISNLAKELGITADQGLIDAVIAETGAKEANTVATTKQAAAQGALNASMLLYVGIAAAGAAVILGIPYLITKSTETRLQEVAAIKEQIYSIAEENKTKQEEIDENLELYNSYINLYEKYEEGLVAKDSMASKTEEVKDALSQEAIAVAELTGNYEYLAEAIKEANNAKIDEKIANEDQTIEDLRQQALTILRPVSGSKEEMDRISNLSMKDLITEYENKRKEAGASDKDFIEFNLNSGMSTIVSEYRKATSRKNDITSIMEGYKNLGKDNLEYNDFESFVLQTQEKRAGYGGEKSRDAVLEDIKKYTTGNEENINRYLATQGVLDKYAKNSEKLSPEALEQGKEELKKQLDKLSSSDFNRIITKLDIDNLTSEKNIKNAIDLANKEAANDDLSIVTSLRAKISSDKKLSKTELKEALGEQEILTSEYEVGLSDWDNQSQLDQVEILNDIVRKKIQINNEEEESFRKLARTSKQENIELKKNTEERKKELEQELELIKKKREQAGDTPAGSILDAAINTKEEEIKKLQLDIDSYEKAIQHLEEQSQMGLAFDDYDQNIFENLTAGVDGLISETQVLADLVVKVGENWTIAGKDIQEFAQNFPEVFAEQENFNYLQDGSIQLTEQGKKALEENLDAYKEKIRLENESYQAELQKQADIQIATAEMYEAQAQALDDYLSGQATGAKTEAKLAKNVNDYKDKLQEQLGLNEKELTELMIDNGLAVVEQSKDDTSKIYDYWVAVGEVAAKAGTAYANGFDDPGRNPSGLQSGIKVTEAKDYKPQKVDQGEFQGLTNEEVAAYRDELLKKAVAARNEAAIYVSKKLGSESEMNAMLNAMDNAISGKGNGKTSKSKEEKEKQIEEEFDRYWEYKKAIDMLDKAMARLQKIQAKLHGKELIDSLKKENELLEKQKANYDALLHAQEREAGELQGKLDYFGATFADSGELTNYADVTKKMLDAYTSGTVSEKAYEDFKKALERYDSLYYSEIQDTLDKLDDARRKQLENNLKGWETEIQIKLDLTEAERNWNDFVRDLEQDFRKIYEDLTIESAFDTKNFETYNDDLNTTLQAINDVENEITKLASTGKSDMFESMSEAQEKLKDLGNELIENGKSLYELYESVWNNYINKLDQAADNLKDINDEFGHITNELEYERKLIELIYGDKAYDKMTKYYDAQQKNINMQIDSLKTQRDFWEDQFQAAYMMNKDEHNVILNDMSTWTEDMRKAYDQMIESQESLNDKITEGIENLTDNYLNKLAETFDKLENAVWNMNLDALSDDWDRITGLADEYLDDVEGIYQIQTLANKIDKDIDNTSDIKAAQKLQAFREKEIAILKQKDNLTQTDVDLAEARYQIMLKEIALEDARNAKNSMRLTRNTSGNWTYQYVADDEDVADKKQDLLQGYQDLYKMADDAYQHSMELLMNTWQEMQEKMQEAAELYKNDSEKLAEEQLKIRESYAPMMEAAAENSELYRQEAITASSAVFSETCDQDAETYQYLTDLQKELVDGVKDKHLEDYEAIRSAVIDGVYPEIAAAAQSAFLETNLNSSTAAADIIHQWADDDGESVKAKLNEAIDSIEDNVKEFENELNIMKEVAGEDFGNVDKEVQGTIDWLDKMGNKTSDMTKKSTDQLDIMRAAVNELGLKFEELTEKIFETAQKMAEYKEATAAAVEEMIRLNIEKSKFDGSEYDPGKGSGGGGGGGSTTSKYKLVSDPYGAAGTLGVMNEEGKYVEILGGAKLQTVQKYVDDPYGVSGTVGVKNTVTGQYEIMSKNDFEANYKQITSKQGYYYDYKKVLDQLSEKYPGITFATGGYTGDWSSDHGALAILHNKELVLNEDDTSNFLKATSLLRDISKINGSIEDSIMTSILGMMSALNPRIGGFNANSSGSQESSGNIFNITAEFPNANDVTSIREAILSLPNIASQYVHQR